MPETPGSAVSTGTDLSSAQSPDQAITPTLESKVQGALDDTFGGVDASDRQPKTQDEPGSGGEAGDTVTVKEHTRKRALRQRSGWEEEERGEDEQAIETNGEASPKPQRNRVKKRGAQADDDLGDLDDFDDPGGNGDPTAGEVFETDIPEHLLNAARRFKWSDEKIQRLIEHDPDTARETFEQFHEQSNRLAQEYADLGRASAGSPTHQAPPVPTTPPPGQGYGANQVPAQVQPQQPGQQNQQPPQQGYMQPFQFDDDYLNGLEPEFKDKFVEPVQKYLGQQAQVMNAVAQRFESFIHERQTEALHMQIDQFFDGLDGYQDLYGKGQRTGLSEVAMMTRQRVAREADMIRAGAFQQGRTMSVQEALEMAHNLVSSPHQETVARKKLTKRVQRRASQLTVRPTHRSGGKGEGDRSDPLAKATRTAAAKLKQLARR